MRTEVRAGRSGRGAKPGSGPRWPVKAGSTAGPGREFGSTDVTKRDDQTAVSLTQPEAVALAHAAELLRAVCVDAKIDVNGTALENAQAKLESALETHNGNAGETTKRQAQAGVAAIADAAVRAVASRRLATIGAAGPPRYPARCRDTCGSLIIAAASATARTKPMTLALPRHRPTSSRACGPRGATARTRA